jgi:hypothetical protein
MPIRAQAIAGALAAGILKPDMPMWQMIRELEMHSGNFVVLPGQQPWFSKADWDETSIVSIAGGFEGKEVRIIAFLARRDGAFDRLIGGIKDVGKTPVVISPIKAQEKRLKERGWRYRIVGEWPMDERQWREPHHFGQS